MFATHQEYSAQTIRERHDLASRPTMLSFLLMHYFILPANTFVTKGFPLRHDDTGRIDPNTWYQRYTKNQNTTTDSTLDELTGNVTHHFTTFHVNGLETIQAALINATNHTKYEIYFCGNAQDGLGLEMVPNHIDEYARDKHCIFWNYPGIGQSAGQSHHPIDLIEAGCQQVQRLLDQGIPAGRIKLYGYSLGGGVAAQVSARFAQTHNIKLTLEIDRSFSSLQQTVCSFILNGRQEKDTRWISGIAAGALMGLTSGAWNARALDDLGLWIAFYLTNETPAYVQAPLMALTFGIEFTFLLLGLVLTFGGLILGLILGIMIGMASTIEQFCFDEPNISPLDFAVHCFFDIIDCHMDTLEAIRRISIHSVTPAPQNTHQKQHVCIKNDIHDRLILPRASLACGVLNAPIDRSPIETQWYRDADHQGVLEHQLDAGEEIRDLADRLLCRA